MWRVAVPSDGDVTVARVHLVTPQKPATNRQRLPYAVQVRFSKAQYAYLLLYADERGMGAVIRDLLDSVIDSSPVLTGPDGQEISAGVKLRSVLERSDLDKLDQAELQRVLQGDAEQGQE